MRKLFLALACLSAVPSAYAMEVARIGENATLLCRDGAPSDCVTLNKNVKVSVVGKRDDWTSAVRIPNRKGVYLVDTVILDFCLN
jgi:hypothetical protein